MLDGSTGIVDDAKSKAKQLESKSKEGIEGAKAQISSDAEVLRSKVASAAGVGAASKASIELYSTKYYAACAGGGVLACGLTHALVTPLDLVKCRRDTGIGPTWVGYSVQGACKYGFYEYFKKKYADAVGPANAVKYKDAIYLAGSASAELIADAAYVPLKAVKVRILGYHLLRPYRLQQRGPKRAGPNDTQLLYLQVGRAAR
ncbi:Cu/Pi carrier [Puccinia graminis f. sp. tritici]|uniref:Cu/Pi carrier n=1 Tax=Puccinia graminis f. sp. tritici TaxID=56615 RepID=A0A5B0NA37_PUCGR|nr:Cu/Pi carrier [Puccinia graminis f. sp. tritici]